MIIDKSLFSAEELEQYDALIAKAKVDPEAAKKEMQGEEPAAPPAKAEKEDTQEVEEVEETKKSASPEIAAALERLESLEKSLEMTKFTEMAKKYAPLGEKEEELAKTFYDMNKANPDNLTAYVAVLDKSLALVEKSGIFAEIGKSTPGTVGGGAVEKVEAAAREIMKADPNATYEEAIMKAWTPDLIKEYESEYNA